MSLRNLEKDQVDLTKLFLHVFAVHPLAEFLSETASQAIQEEKSF
jgi:hypothetical protein